ncbi:hypothetical protein RA13_05100 [Bacillus atrophaeus]|nr:hypothetical protein RA13_05100 [Bacillus atrophaeus]
MTDRIGSYFDSSYHVKSGIQSKIWSIQPEKKRMNFPNPSFSSIEALRIYGILLTVILINGG